MDKRNFKISASGLKNIILNNSFDDEFTFIIGNEEIHMKKIFADFISPRISRIHHADPTIDSFCFDNYITENQKAKITEIFPTNLLHKFEEISRGNPIEVDPETSVKLLILSVILDNSEIYDGMNDLFANEINQTKIEFILQFFQLFETTKTTFSIFNPAKFYDIISSNFHSIDENQLLQLPKTVIYSIISNEHLKVKSEDSLFDFINKLFVNDEDDENDEFDMISFYEKIDMINLSKEKLNEFLDRIKISNMTSNLWQNVKHFISIARPESRENEASYVKQHKEEKVSFSGSQDDRFKGIISRLGNGNAKSAYENKIIDITAASCHNDSFHPSKALEDGNNDYYHSLNTGTYRNEGHTEWLCVDFKERRVKPSHYSIQSFPWGSGNLQNWVLEGSNDGESWKDLDTQNGNKSLAGYNISNTFEVPNGQNNQFYRYLRIRQTGVNTANDYRLIIASLEYFGLIKEAC